MTCSRTGWRSSRQSGGRKTLPVPCVLHAFVTKTAPFLAVLQAARQGHESAVRAGHQQGRPPGRDCHIQRRRLPDRHRARERPVRWDAARGARHEGHGRCAAVVSASQRPPPPPKKWTAAACGCECSIISSLNVSTALPAARNDEKGFGFIDPLPAGENVFVRAPTHPPTCKPPCFSFWAQPHMQRLSCVSCCNTCFAKDGGATNSATAQLRRCRDGGAVTGRPCCRRAQVHRTNIVSSDGRPVLVPGMQVTLVPRHLSHALQLR